jgi:hypothetical protein
MRTEKERLLDKKEKLSEERQTFTERRVEVTSQRRELKKSMDQDQQVRVQTLKDNMDYEVLEQSPTAKSFADKVLLSKIDGGDNKQLEANLRKFEAAEQYCRDREREISIELKDINKQIRYIEQGESLKAARDAYERWYESVIANEEAFEHMRQTFIRCHSYNMNYQLEIPKHGLDDDPMFLECLESKMRPQIVGRKLQVDLLRELSKIRMIEPNRWYIHPSRTNERRQNRRAMYDPRRVAWDMTS